MKQRTRIVLAAAVLVCAVAVCLGQGLFEPPKTPRVLRAENKLLRTQVQALKDRVAALTDENGKLRRRLAGAATSRPMSRPTTATATTQPTTRPVKALSFAEIVQATRDLPGNPTALQKAARRKAVNAWAKAREGRAVHGQMMAQNIFPQRTAKGVVVIGWCGQQPNNPSVRAVFNQRHRAALAKVGRGWTLAVRGKLSMEGGRWLGRIILTDCRLVRAIPPKKPKRAGN